MFIFLPPILLGLGFAFIKARFNIQLFRVPNWKAGFIIPVALLLMLPVTTPHLLHLEPLDNIWAALLLGGSQILLLSFVMLNSRQTGLWILGIGFLLNMICMQANGGLMPVQPKNVAYMLGKSELSAEDLIGSRFGNSKDIVLSLEETNLWYLGDQFTLPNKFPYRVVFSLGDIIIGIGLFYMLYRMVPGNFIELGAHYEYKPYRINEERH